VCALRTLVARKPAVLLAVADGLGGLPAGEHAADLALQVVGHYAHCVIPDTEAGRPLRDALAEMLRAAGRSVWLWARDQGHGGAAGTTLVSALVWGRHFLVVHAGDSRCYRIDARGASVLTRDHAETVRLDPARGPAPGPGRTFPVRRRLTSVLGWPTDAVVDVTPADGEPGSVDDGVLLLCSDGLHTVVDEEDMHAAVHETGAVEHACRRLVALALGRGSTDNVSVAAVEVGSLRRRGLSDLTWPRTPS
jgi:protein phosphatase